MPPKLRHQNGYKFSFSGYPTPFANFWLRSRRMLMEWFIKIQKRNESQNS